MRLATAKVTAACLGALVLVQCDDSPTGPAPVDHFLIEAAGGGAIGRVEPNVPFVIRITAQDAANNTVTTFSGAGSTVDVSAVGATLASGGGTTSAFGNGVLAAHLVRFTTEGTAVTISATRTGGAQSGASVPFAVDARPTVTSTSPTNGATDVLASATITINFSESVSFAAASFALECPSGTPLGFTTSASPAVSATLTPAGNLPSATTCAVTVEATEIADQGPGGPGAQLASDHQFGFTVETLPVQANDDDYSGTPTRTVTGNVRFTSGTAAPPFSVTDNDVLGPTAAVTFAGWNGVSGKTEQGGDVVVVGTAGDPDIGSFSYDPPAGSTGTDRFQYTLDDGLTTDDGTVTLAVADMIWFVDNGAAPCTTRTAGCGRLTSPYSTLGAFQAENDGDAVFLFESATPYTGPLTLLAGQRLIGQDAAADLATITGITPNLGTDALPVMNPGNPTRTRIGGAGGGITLGTGNTVTPNALLY